MPGHRTFAARQRARAQSEGVSELQFGNPLPTFRASMRGDLTYDRVIYPSDLTSGDLVWFDYWDHDYDRRFFDTTDFEEDIDGVPCVGGVTLLVNGLYVIYGQVDFDSYFSGVVCMGSNYDDGQFTTHIVDQSSGGDLVGVRMQHFRYLWSNFTNEENQAYCLIYHNADVGDLTIPGGYNGSWGVVPVFYVTYLGSFDGPPNFGQDANF